MPQIFRIVPYSIYFWSNESDPLEPIHVHISEGRATSNATKIWITSTGKTVIKVLGENPGACPWDEAKKYFYKSLMSISSEYTLQI